MVGFLPCSAKKAPPYLVHAAVLTKQGHFSKRGTRMDELTELLEIIETFTPAEMTQFLSAARERAEQRSVPDGPYISE